MLESEAGLELQTVYLPLFRNHKMKMTSGFLLKPLRSQESSTSFAFLFTG